MPFIRVEGLRASDGFNRPRGILGIANLNSYVLRAGEVVTLLSLKRGLGQKEVASVKVQIEDDNVALLKVSGQHYLEGKDLWPNVGSIHNFMYLAHLSSGEQKITKQDIEVRVHKRNNDKISAVVWVKPRSYI